jgi:hypothetical protein
MKKGNLFFILSCSSGKCPTIIDQHSTMTTAEPRLYGIKREFDLCEKRPTQCLAQRRGFIKVLVRCKKKYKKS